MACLTAGVAKCVSVDAVAVRQAYFSATAREM